MSGAAFNRGSSKQDYSTPREFLDAVEKRYGRLTFDLAAHSGNHVTPLWYGPGGEEEDSLATDWGHLLDTDIAWLNPPFDHIEPWAAKCASYRYKRILLLVPASVGSNWFSDYVFPHADVDLLRPRLSFDGKNPYPKDTLIAAYGFSRHHGIDCWKWK